MEPQSQIRRGWQAIAGGDFAPIPVLIALAVICVVFQTQTDKFLTPENISNLFAQIVPISVIATGVVLVLLVGEIDLAVGIVSGLAATVAVVLNVDVGVAGWLGMLMGLGVGALIGLFTGIFVAYLNVPSFVVTLAEFLALQGVLLLVLGSEGSRNVQYEGMKILTSTYYSDAFGWVLAAVIIAIYATALVLHSRRRQEEGLRAVGTFGIGWRVGAVAAVVLGVIAILNSDRGVPLGLVVMLAIVVGLDVLTRKTGFGRHIFAVGGNAEAARRAGVHVRQMKVAVFMLGSMLAAAGGMIAASRLLIVSGSSGGGNVLLMVIAAAVIGGTSLFGGRGSVWAAPLGALVIGAIANGMGLLSLSSSVQYIVTGGVLLAAVTFDSMTRRGQGR